VYRRPTATSIPEMAASHDCTSRQVI
jgi:hypothetical protein